MACAPASLSRRYDDAESCPVTYYIQIDAILNVFEYLRSVFFENSSKYHGV